MSDERTTIFLYGADMDPEAMHRALPDGRFVARARVPAASLPTSWPSNEATTDVWGILVETAARGGDLAATTDGAEGPTVPPITATTDDGRAIPATPATPPAALADPGATIAAARYWELPPAYVAALAAAFIP